MYFATLALLSACGGGGDVPEVTTDLDEMYVAIGALQSAHPADDYTALSDLPDSGSAAYAGYMSTELSNRTDDVTNVLAGEVLISVDFGASDMVSGSAQDFLDQDGNPILGALDIAGGVLDRAGDPFGDDATFQFSGDGVLTDQDGRELTLEISFDGDFLGSNHEAIGGDVTGSVTADGNGQNLLGIFILEGSSP
ncbi:hypothetical protein [Loktanella sp. S4079]|uniref:hypothetical protein n=1 Tax=Loktanella sp. S4079 TaxID=579483 RepID=UPI0005FA8D06|nr:hypothetical protein [Loktanella sp. S4079]KJZ17929.1 hypothetical protein TW80_16470 [Loktanella sp. S4079]